MKLIIFLPMTHSCLAVFLQPRFQVRTLPVTQITMAAGEEIRGNVNSFQVAVIGAGLSGTC